MQEAGAVVQYNEDDVRIRQYKDQMMYRSCRATTLRLTISPDADGSK